MILLACNWLGLTIWTVISTVIVADSMRGRSVRRDAAILIMIAIVLLGLLNGVLPT